MIIGITGSIGSGKTTVAKFFEKYGYGVINADEIGHALFKKDSIVYRNVVKEFGEEIIDSGKNIDRKKLGDIVFNENKSLKKLNDIMHPVIINEIKNQVKKIKSSKESAKKIVVDAPLLLETEAGKLVDEIIVVKCDEKIIFERASKMFQKEKIEKILKSQMPLDRKLEYADFVIDNDGDLKNLEKQVNEIIGILNKK